MERRRKSKEQVKDNLVSQDDGKETKEEDGEIRKHGNKAKD